MSSPLAADALDAANRAKEVRKTLESSFHLHQVIVDALVGYDDPCKFGHLISVLCDDISNLNKVLPLAEQTEKLLYKQFRAIAEQGEVQEDAA